MKQLDPKFIWMYFISSSIGLIVILTFVAFFIFPFTATPTPTMDSSLAEKVLNTVFAFWLTLITVGLVINFLWAKLTYKYYKYELREDGFRKEHGVIWKKYVTIPYERIQNVDIYRGLLARIFGLSDLHIQTAGMSTTRGSYGGGAEGRLPGLSPEIAEQLRDELVKRARGKSQGL